MEFMAIDLETTGTLPYVDRIVEVAAVHFKGNKVVNKFQTLVRPGIEISEEVSKINGITNKMVEDQPEIQNVLEPFARFCSSYPMVAHNASFDFQFLRSVIEKYKTKAPEGVLLDSYALAKKVLPNVNNYRLGTLVQYLKIKHSTLHRAVEDAICCGRVFYHLIEKLQTSNVKKLAQISGKAELKFPQLQEAYSQLQLSF